MQKTYKKLATTSVHGKVTVSEHAIEKFRKRQFKMDMSREEVIGKIINQVRHSKLIEIEGTKEFRSHNGYVYVIQREFKKDAFGLLNEDVTVVTMLMSKLRIKEKLSSDFSLDTIDKTYITGFVC